MKVEINVDTDKISNALISALEGGSNYWYTIIKKIPPITWEFENDNGERYRGEGKHWMQDYPLNPNGALIIDDISEDDAEPDHKAMRLDLDSIKKGLGIMAKKYPNQFGDLLSDNGDAETGDILLQCSLFGDAIYG